MKLVVVLRNSPRLAHIDNVDEQFLANYNWYLHSTGCVFGNASVKINGKWVTKNVRLHRLLMDAPKNAEVDHIDGNKLNNCRENLRLCTHVENSWNRKSSRNRSGFRGVTWHNRNKKWRARIKIHGREVLLGYFDSAKEASEIFELNREKLHKEFLWQG